MVNFILKNYRLDMGMTMNIREARCLDCKYYVPAPKPFAISMCGLKDKPTNRKSLVCKDWKYKYE